MSFECLHPAVGTSNKFDDKSINKLIYFVFSPGDISTNSHGIELHVCGINIVFSLKGILEIRFFRVLFLLCWHLNPFHPIAEFINVILIRWISIQYIFNILINKWQDFSFQEHIFSGFSRGRGCYVVSVLDFTVNVICHTPSLCWLC